MNQGQAIQPGTPSYCSTWTHTIFQTERSIELTVPNQDIVLMGGQSGDGMPSEVSHLRCLLISEVKKYHNDSCGRILSSGPSSVSLRA